MLTILNVSAHPLRLTPSLPHLMVVLSSHLRNSRPSSLSAECVSNRSCRRPRLPTQVLIIGTLKPYRVPIIMAGSIVNSNRSRHCAWLPTLAFFPPTPAPVAAAYGA